MDRLRQISQQLNNVQDWPDFKAGDTLKVSYKIKEGSKERTQVFQGTVIQRRGEGPTETFTVRKMASWSWRRAGLPHQQPLPRSHRSDESG